MLLSAKTRLGLTITCKIYSYNVMGSLLITTDSNVRGEEFMTTQSLFTTHMQALRVAQKVRIKRGCRGRIKRGNCCGSEIEISVKENKPLSKPAKPLGLYKHFHDCNRL